MKATRYWLLALLFLFLVVASPVGLSSKSTREVEPKSLEEMTRELNEEKRLPLVGLQGVVPQVFFTPTYRKGDDKIGGNIGMLSQQEMQTEVEIALRKVGIKIIEKRDVSDGVPSTVGQLIIMVGASRFPDDFGDVYCFEVNVSLRQFVSLCRRPDIVILNDTWPDMNFVEVELAGRAYGYPVEEKIKRRVMKEVNEFINDYLAANPKEPVKPFWYDDLVEPNKPKDEQKQ